MATKNEFLNELAEERWKEQYLEIEILDYAEVYIATITGYATGGNLNLNGSSYIRKTGSISMLAGGIEKTVIQEDGTKQIVIYDNYDITVVNSLINLHKKVRVRVGFLNTLKQKYSGQIASDNTDDTFLLDTDIIWIPLGVFLIKGANISESAQGINISLTLTDKSSILNGEVGGVIPVHTIFSEADILDISYAASGSEKILIKDIIKRLIKDFGKDPKADNASITVPTRAERVIRWNGDKKLKPEKSGNIITLYKEDDTDGYSNGQDIGYSIEPFYYPGTLECNAGETVASVLDKIKNLLGNYDWYYDTNGIFHFEPNNNYDIQSSSAGEALTVASLSAALDSLPQTSSNYLTSESSVAKQSIYNFSDKKLNIISIAKNPQYMNIKNDYIVWGSKETASGGSKSIRYHLVFDKKPDDTTYSIGECVYYNDYSGLQRIIILNDSNKLPVKPIPNDNPSEADKKKFYISDSDVYKYNLTQKRWEKSNQYKYATSITSTDWRSAMYLMALKGAGYDSYKEELIAEIPKLYTIVGVDTNADKTLTLRSDISTDNVDYWIDFLGSSEDDPCYNYRISNIGRRTKVVSDTSVNCVFKTEIPKVAIVNADGDIRLGEIPLDKDENDAYKYNYLQVSPEIWNKCATGGTQNSAFEKLVELLTIHTQYDENITISCIPFYHWEPNSWITIDNKNYLIKTISLPLAANGITSITATRGLMNPLNSGS